MNRALGWVIALLGLWLAELEFGGRAMLIGAPLLALAWWRRVNPPVGLIFAAAVATVLLHHSSPGAPVSGAVGGALPAEPVTQASWAQALLSRLGDPESAENLRAVVAWERAEGGHWQNEARFNPLNTTQAEPGSVPINTVGVQAYPSWDEGLTATVATLRNGRYDAVLATLAGASCAPCVAAAVAASPWGTGSFPT